MTICHFNSVDVIWLMSGAANDELSTVLPSLLISASTTKLSLSFNAIPSSSAQEPASPNSQAFILRLLLRVLPSRKTNRPSIATTPADRYAEFFACLYILGATLNSSDKSFLLFASPTVMSVDVMRVSGKKSALADRSFLIFST